MSKNKVFQSITNRRSVRSYTAEPITDEEFDRLVEAARWAPSGLNNQPWRLVTVRDSAMLEKLAGFTKYSRILAGCRGAVAVFLDTSSIYHREKDIQSIGAAIQNILLAAHEMGVGTCWLGEILNRRDEVEKALQVAPELELMAVVALGRPTDDSIKPGKRYLPEKIVVGRF